jgi:uncharacterized repeat protein (TIGR01451 family)
MTPLEHVSILWIDDLYRGRFTTGGRVLLWGAVAAATMQLGGLTDPLVYCFGICVSSLFVAMAAGTLFRPRLQMSRQIITFPSAGEIFSYRVSVKNVGRRVARNVVIEERGLPPDLRPVDDSPVIVALEPGERVSVTLKLSCLRRGAYDLEQLQGASSLPAGLFKSGQKVAMCDRLLVYPRIVEVGTFEVPHSRNHQPGGIAVASHVGESTEFLGMRDWRQGDRLRDIHWPSTARVGRLIAKEFQEEYFVRLAVVLDIEAPRARDVPRLERAVSLTAGITDVDPGNRLDTQALQSVLLPEAPRLSAVVFVMMDWDSERANLVNLLKAHGLAVRVISMHKERQPDGLEPSEIVKAPT